MKRILILAGAAITATVVTASIALGLGSNGSFETGTNPGPAFMFLFPGSTAIDGWTVESGTIDYIGGWWQAADGSRSVDLNGGSPGTISQTFATTVGSTYAVRFSLSGNPDDDPGLKTLTVSATGAAAANYSFDTSVGNTRTDMMWVTKLYNFTATSSTTTLRFISTTSATPAWYGPALDNVTIHEVIRSADGCKMGDWELLTDSEGNTLKNQGDCVSFFATDGKNLGAGI